MIVASVGLWTNIWLVKRGGLDGAGGGWRGVGGGREGGSDVCGPFIKAATPLHPHQPFFLPSDKQKKMIKSRLRPSLRNARNRLGKWKYDDVMTQGRAVMLYYVILCYVMLCYVISCYGDKLCSLRVDLQICDEQGRLPSWSTDFEGRCWWKKGKCWSSSSPSSHRLMTKSWFSHDLVLGGFLFQSTLKNTSSKLYWECLLNMSQFLRIRERKIIGSDANRVNH